MGIILGPSDDGIALASVALPPDRRRAVSPALRAAFDASENCGDKLSPPRRMPGELPAAICKVRGSSSTAVLVERLGVNVQKEEQTPIDFEEANPPLDAIATSGEARNVAREVGTSASPSMSM